MDSQSFSGFNQRMGDGVSSTISQKKTSKLLRWLIFVSLLIHVPIYLHMNGLLDTKVLHYIDLTVRKGDDSESRKRLRPPLIVKNKGGPDKAQASLMVPTQAPKNTRLYNEGDTPVSAYSSNAGIVPLPEINKVDISSDVDVSTFSEIGSGAGLTSIGLGGIKGAITIEDYLEKVRRKVERNNRFPMGKMRIRGFVKVQLVINLDGTIRDLKILIPSTQEVYNRQALKAVRNSEPFEKPPPYIFKNPIQIPLNFHYYL